MAEHVDGTTRILVVDDEPRNLALIRKILTAAGYPEPVTLTDPHEVLPTLESLVPDLVLLDLHMPGLDGFTLLEQLRAATTDQYLPVLVLTADTTGAARDRALARGANDFLTKPFDRTELLLRTANLLGTRALHVQLQEHNALLDAQVRARTIELERFKRVFDVLHEPVALLDPVTLEATYTNHEADRLRGGSSPVAPTGKRSPHVVDLIRHHDAQPVVEGRHDDATYRATVAGPDGAPLPVDVHVQRIAAPTGADALVVLARDRTPQHEAEQALRAAADRERAAAERLRALDDLKGRFLTAVSHELRTPLTLVLGAAELLAARDTALDPATSAQLTSTVLRGAQRLDALVGDLNALDTSAGPAAGELQEVRLDQVIREAIAASAVAERATFSATPLSATVDRAKITAMLEKLLDNADRYGRVDSPIDVALATDAQEAVIRVEDRGPGVPDGLVEELFLPFRQGPNAHAHSPGTGIGLTVVRLYARQHGGDAWLEERSGGGTTAVVRLPVSPAEPVTSHPGDGRAS